jgi:hypothetical protein
VAGVAAARPAAASMTMVFRWGPSRTMKLSQEDSRVRDEIPPGPNEPEGDRLTAIVDLKTSERVLVYDDVKAYFDMNKTLAAVRVAVERAGKGKPRERRPPAATYRTLAQPKTINGYTCEMYQRLVAGRADGEVCFVLWGDAIGPKEDFEWLDTFFDRMVSDIAGKRGLAMMSRARENTPGLAIWTSSTNQDGKREVLELVTLRREALPSAMFHVPAEYTETPRPLTASERSTSGPPVAEVAKGAGAQNAVRRSGLKLSGLAAILIIAVLGFGLLVHSALLHIAACIVIDHPRFMQALIATAIVWLMSGFIWVLGLPPVLGVPVGALATFAGVKMSYGVSVPRTIALFIVSGVISVMLGLLGRIFT